VGAIGSAERVGAVYEFDRESGHDTSVQAGVRESKEIGDSGAGAVTARCGRRGVSPTLPPPTPIFYSEKEATLPWLISYPGQTLANGVLITRVKSMPRGIHATAKEVGWELQPALKVCITSGLSRKEIERAGITIRHAVTKIASRRR